MRSTLCQSYSISTLVINCVFRKCCHMSVKRTAKNEQQIKRKSGKNNEKNKNLIYLTYFVILVKLIAILMNRLLFILLSLILNFIRILFFYLYSTVTIWSQQIQILIVTFYKINFSSGMKRIVLTLPRPIYRFFQIDINDVTIIHWNCSSYFLDFCQLSSSILHIAYLFIYIWLALTQQRYQLDGQNDSVPDTNY